MAGWLALRGFRALLRRVGARLPGAVRHGIANLYRPGNQAQAAVVALGVGVMFTLTVFLVQNGAGGSDPRHRAAGHAERVSAGHSGEPAAGAQPV